MLFDVILQIANLLRYGFDSLSAGEIIPFSGINKSGAGSIAHAADAGLSVRGTSCVDLQPALTRSNITFKLSNSGFSIFQLSDVSGIQCGDVSLPGLHVFEGGACLCKVMHCVVRAFLLIAYLPEQEVDMGRAGITDEQITAALEEYLKVNMTPQWTEPKDGEPHLHKKP